MEVIGFSLVPQIFWDNLPFGLCCGTIIKVLS